MSPQDTVLLRIRPALPDPDDKASLSRGPLLMEQVLSVVHSLKGKAGILGLEIGSFEGKVCFFVRASKRAAALVESQMYAQYPDIDIEYVDAAKAGPMKGQSVLTSELVLSNAEVFPIKRHPQFDDLLSRQNIDPLAAITQTLVRFPIAGMRGHVQLIIQPLDKKFRKRVFKFLPIITRGFFKRFDWYVRSIAYVHLARGWRWWAWLPVNILLGGFRAWFSPMPEVAKLLSDATDSAEEYAPENPDGSITGKRSHEREDTITAIADKANRLLFIANVRVSVLYRPEEQELAAAKLEEVISSFKQFTLPHFNGFNAENPKQKASLVTDFTHVPYVLSVEELATLWHLPNVLVKTPNIDWVSCRKLEPPTDLPMPNVRGAGGRNLEFGDDPQIQDSRFQIPDQGLTVLGEAVFRGHRQQFGIRSDDRRRHMYIIGKTGMGKSTLLENMIYADIHAGRGVGVVDPHGDLIEAILKFIPKNRSNDVILFDPADRDFPLAFNMLSCERPEDYSLVVSGMMSVFTKMWPDAWSGRMEHILRNTLLALIETPGNSMLGILRMFADDAFRAKIVSHLKDQLVRSFWEDEYAGWSEKYRTEAIAAIQNKIGQLLSVPMIRNVVGQSATKLDLREAMDTGKIVLVNLSKGNLGEDNSAFLGSMLVTKFQLDAMSRADIPEAQRKDFYLYVDEFQNFATESFASILSEARKYRLNLTIAHQYVGQLLLGDGSTALRDAVFGNVGSMVSFQVGSDDAEVMSLQFEEAVLPKDILSLPKYHAYVRLMIGGMPSKPFSAATLPPPMLETDERSEVVRRLSRERYSEKRDIVEDKIGKWIASSREAKAGAVKAEKAKEKEAEEREKAKKKGMKLEEYRAWRDRELWTNEYNALRKKMITSELSADDKKKMLELEPKLQASGGIPPPSKAMKEAMGG